MNVRVRASGFCLLFVLLMSCGGTPIEASTGFPSAETLSVGTADDMIEQRADPGPDSATSTTETIDLGAPAAAGESFTAASAAQIAAQRVSQTQPMMYSDDAELANIINTATTTRGRAALRMLVDSDLAPVRNALATAPPATTWFLVRPLSVAIPTLDEATGRAETTVWSLQVFSRVGVADPEMLFFETDVVLMWDGSAWLLDGYSVRPGPAARLGPDQYPVTAPELELRLDGHRLIDPVSLEGWGI